MRQIINGKRYNTETATYVAELSHPRGCGWCDHQYWRAYLYLTTRGNWFLAGSGGPATMFACSVGGGYSGGRGIVPLTPEEARDWLERCGEHDIIEQYADKLGEIEDA